jgi:hypothetical protein
MLRCKHFVTFLHAFKCFEQKTTEHSCFDYMLLICMKPGAPSFLTSTHTFSYIPLSPSALFPLLPAFFSALFLSMSSSLCCAVYPMRSLLCALPSVHSSTCSFDSFLWSLLPLLPLPPLPFNALPYVICTLPSTFFSLRSASFLCALSFAPFLPCLALLFCALLCPPEHSLTHTHTQTYTHTHTHTHTHAHTHAHRQSHKNS